jgi:hypothetical protein
MLHHSTSWGWFDALVSIHAGGPVEPHTLVVLLAIAVGFAIDHAVLPVSTPRHPWLSRRLPQSASDV